MSSTTHRLRMDIIMRQLHYQSIPLGVYLSPLTSLVDFSLRQTPAMNSAREMLAEAAKPYTTLLRRRGCC